MPDEKPKCPECGKVDRMEHHPKLPTMMSYARHDAAGKLLGRQSEPYDAGEESRWYCDRCRRWLSSFAPVPDTHPARHEGDE
jgi:hypothetical protein